MLAVRASPAGLSESDLEMAARLVEAEVCDPSSPSYALIARILKEDRPVTPDADLSALLVAMEGHEGQNVTQSDVNVAVTRDTRGSAGFAFDCVSLKITSVKRDRRDLASMQIGDTITAVNGAPVRTAREYHRAAKGVHHFRLTLHRTPEQSAQQPTARNATRQRQARRAPPRGPSEAEMRAMAMDVDRMSYEDLLALDESHPPVKHPGLQESAIRDFPVEHVVGGGGECAICLEEFFDGDEAMRLPCSHMFHADCAREWLTRQSRCPYCNFELKG